MAYKKRVELSTAEIKFCHEFMIDDDGKRAFKKAFPKRKLTESSLYTSYLRMLKDVRIRSYINYLRKEYIKKAGTTPIKIYREYIALAHSDITQCFDLNTDKGWHLLPPRKISRHVRKAISSIQVEDTRYGQKVKITMKDKIAALDKLAIHCGFNSELPDTEKILAFVPEHLREAIRLLLTQGGKTQPAIAAAQGDSLGSSQGDDRRDQGEPQSGNGVGRVEAGPVAGQLSSIDSQTDGPTMLPTSGEIRSVGGEDIDALFGDE